MPTPLAALTLALAASIAQAQQVDPQARWQAERLERQVYEQVVVRACEPEPLTSMPTASQPVTEYESARLERWGVFTGNNIQLDAFSFAQQVGDTATLAELERRVRRTRTGGWLTTSLGALALGSGVAMVASVSQQQDGSRTLTTVGAGLSLVGMVGSTAGLRLAIAPRKLHSDVDHSWEPQQAEALIRAHNQALRQQLGLPPD